MAKRKSSDYIDVRELVSDYMSKWYLFLISIVLCAALAFLYLRVKKPEYEVRANIAIAQSDNGPMATFSSLGNIFGSDGYTEDEIFVISSHSLYHDVVRDLALNKSHYVKDGFMLSHMAYKDFPIEVFAEPNVEDTLSKVVVFKTEVDKNGKVDVKAKVKRSTIAKVKDATFPVTMDTPYGKFVLNKTDHFPTGEEVESVISITGYHKAAEDIAEDIQSEIASRKSNVISMVYETPYPEVGHDLLNEIIKKYNERGINEKNMQAEMTADFIDARLKILATDLTDAEASIQQYKQNQGIVDVSTEASYQTRKKAEAESKLLEAETESEIIKMTREFIGNPENAFSLIPTSAGSESVKSAINAYNQLILRRMDLQNNAKNNNTALRRLEDQINAMRGNIDVSLDKAYETSLVTIKEIRGEMNRAMGRLGNIPTQEREFRDMARQQQIKQQLYLFLLQRREETAMLLANSTPKGLVVDEAYTLNEPITLKPKMVLLIALFLGLIFPPVILYIRKLMRNRFETRREVERLTDVPIIGEICTDNSGRSIVVTESDTSSTTELFRLMRTNLEFVLNGADDKVVLMTSTSSGEGKSFISINLAASLALLNKKVILIGMDIRNPRLAQYMSLTPSKGLTQYLSTPGMPMTDIINAVPGIKNLDVIVAGPVPPNPAELLKTERVDRLFAELRKHYDYIIVDSAPVGMVSDSFTLDRISDATVYVCRANYSPSSSFDFINDISDNKRLKKMSLVINGVATKKGYGYGYGYNNKNEKKKKGLLDRFKK